MTETNPKFIVALSGEETKEFFELVRKVRKRQRDRMPSPTLKTNERKASKDK